MEGDARRDVSLNERGECASLEVKSPAGSLDVISHAVHARRIESSYAQFKAASFYTFLFVGLTERLIIALVLNRMCSVRSMDVMRLGFVVCHACQRKKNRNPAYLSIFKTVWLTGHHVIIKGFEA